MRFPSFLKRGLVAAGFLAVGLAIWLGAGEHSAGPPGYKVVFIPFRDGFPDGALEDFLTGSMPRQNDSRAYGRPVGVIVDRTGALLMADDTGNMIWRVSVNQ
jgi:glucose/arabinose dehydrogenase